MPYNTDRTGSTLTDAEMAAEATRILRRLDSSNFRESTSLSGQAINFVDEKLGELESFNMVEVTVKQLYWLRDINEKVD